MIYIKLFIEFFKIGLFSIGGGLATLPFLYDLANKYTWFDKEMIVNMVAVSESTPGPIGVNMATFAGFHSGGIFGGILATIGLVAPSIIIIITIAHFLEKFKESEYVKSVFYGLRPAVTGLIAAAGFEVLKIAILNLDKFKEFGEIRNLINMKATILLVILLYLTNKYKKHPIVYIGLAAVIGVVFKF